MRDEFDNEADRFHLAVRNRAAQLVRDGLYAPYEAIDKAREQIMQERRERADAEKQRELSALLGRVG